MKKYHHSILDSYDLKFQEAVAKLKDNLDKTISLKISTYMFNSMEVLSHGHTTSCHCLATIDKYDDNTVAITPWNKEDIKNIERALNIQNKWVVRNNNNTILVSNHPISYNDREILAKEAKLKGDKAYLFIRQIRSEVRDWLYKKVKPEALEPISRDIFELAKKDLDIMTTKYHNEIKTIVEHKQREILSLNN